VERSPTAGSLRHQEYRYRWTYSERGDNVEKKDSDQVSFREGRLNHASRWTGDGHVTFSIVERPGRENVTAVPASVSFVRDAHRRRNRFSSRCGPPMGPSCSRHRRRRRDRRERALPPAGHEQLHGALVPIGRHGTSSAIHTTSSRDGRTSGGLTSSPRVPLLAPPARVVTNSTELSFFEQRQWRLRFSPCRRWTGLGTSARRPRRPSRLGHYQVVTRVGPGHHAEGPPHRNPQGDESIGRGFREQWGLSPRSTWTASTGAPRGTSSSILPRC